jgi:hypothetical protein
MQDSKSRMASFKVLGTEKKELMSELPKSCFAGRIYLVCEGRNTWNRRWKETYLGGMSFHLRFRRAVDYAETFRVQGSRWTIQRMACCVFASDKYSLLVTEINNATPLFRYDLDQSTEHGLSLYDLARRFEPRSPNSVIRQVTVRKRIKRWDGRFLAYRSKSHGANARLEWEMSADRAHPRAIPGLVYSAAR